MIKNTGNKQVDLARLSIKERDSKYSPTFPHPPERSTLVIVKNSTPGICERSVAVIYENSKRKHG